MFTNSIFTESEATFSYSDPGTTTRLEFNSYEEFASSESYSIICVVCPDDLAMYEFTFAQKGNNLYAWGVIEDGEALDIYVEYIYGGGEGESAYLSEVVMDIKGLGLASLIINW